MRLRLEHQQREERQLKLQVQHQRDYLHNCARDNVAMVSIKTLLTMWHHVVVNIRLSCEIKKDITYAKLW